MRRTLAIGFAPAAALVIAASCAPPPEITGRSLYQTYCTDCHGSSARGDGPLAAGLDRPVPDLTLIASRNDGTFDTAGVMSIIDGYTRARDGEIVMPEFGMELQAGPLVLFDSGDGVPTPTPSRLVALAAYLETLQR